MPNGRISLDDINAYYTRYGSMVFRRCLQLLRDEEKAKDALQEVFVKMLSRREDLKGQYPSALLFRISTNVCLNMLRSQRRRPQGGDDILDGIAAFDENEDRTVLGDLLEKLFRKEKSSTREMAVLHFVDGMTLKEVARETGLSVSGVRKRIREFRSRVRAQRGLYDEH